MNQISILGCGWLGLPLAKQLITKGYSVKGTTTTPQKTESLQQLDIAPYVIALQENKVVGDFSSFLDGSKILIINIPPSLRKDNNESFVAKINILIPMIESSQVDKVLFVSSTSVYGANNGVITEITKPILPVTESGKQLLEVERLLQSNTRFKTTILRFGGLIGADRHPVHYLAGKENVANPNAAINLIHQDDCINIILKIIENEAWADTFNAVAPYHPSRKEYYTEKAREKNLPLPSFSREEVSKVKMIAVDKVKEVLKYGFTLNNL
ncbi:SDR family oxidoreductase [uncultured Flavobacterium sp.]|uniref:SDR family oxidoreductase n=1 Tax=uncultured Flavobacterium sp. TaxID=165435 RepID=UPI0025EE80FB|nr:SDR family oxidoreductase [uncultured Flavobacterium sp.]